MKLTNDAIKKLTLPPGKQDQVFWDDAVPGFGVRLRQSGACSYRVQYDFGGRSRGMSLGPVSLLELSQARAKARQLLAQVRLGHDPAYEKTEARSKAAETFGALLTRYLAHKATKVRPSSIREITRHLVRYARPLHSRPITTIDRRTIAALVASVSGKSGAVAANCMAATLCGYFSWATREGIFNAANPASNLNLPATNGARKRLLLDAEVAAILAALGEGDYADIVRLLLFTGARRAEIGSLLWSEIDLAAAEIRLPGERTKNHRAHVIPLAPPALDILKRRWAARDPDAAAVFGCTVRGFQSWSQCKRELDQSIALEPWTPHDFRRFISTKLHERGVVPHVVEAVLGHVSVFKSGVAGTYNLSTYLNERRRVLNRWSEYIEELATGKRVEATVIKYALKVRPLQGRSTSAAASQHHTDGGSYGSGRPQQ
jgi:integrase